LVEAEKGRMEERDQPIEMISRDFGTMGVWVLGVLIHLSRQGMLPGSRLIASRRLNTQPPMLPPQEPKSDRDRGEEVILNEGEEQGRLIGFTIIRMNEDRRVF
jgi:hypothetical protein